MTEDGSLTKKAVSNIEYRQTARSEKSVCPAVPDTTSLGRRQAYEYRAVRVAEDDKGRDRRQCRLSNADYQRSLIDTVLVDGHHVDLLTDFRDCSFYDWGLSS
jgi:hypothetical protein